MNIKGILFDCDGVLLDSEAIYINSLIDYLSTLDIKTDLKDIVDVLGKKMPCIIKTLRSKFPLQNYTDEELITGQRKIFNQRFNQINLQPMPYLIEFLKWCKLKKIKTVIVSSSNMNYLKNTINRLNICEYFDEIFSGDMVQNSKPAPDIYLYAAKKLNIPRKQLLIIEDSINGIKAGKKSEIFTVGYKGSVIEQDTGEADLEVRSFEDIKHFLESGISQKNYVNSLV